MRGAGSWAAFGGVLLSCRLMVLVLLVLATPALAQSVDLGAADKLANGTVAYVLAVMVVAEAAVIVFLFREMRKESTGRLEDQARANENSMRIQGESVKLSLQALQSIDVVERVVERFVPAQRG